MCNHFKTLHRHASHYILLIYSYFLENIEYFFQRCCVRAHYLFQFQELRHARDIYKNLFELDPTCKGFSLSHFYNSHLLLFEFIRMCAYRILLKTKSIFTCISITNVQQDEQNRECCLSVLFTPSQLLHADMGIIPAKARVLLAYYITCF